MKTFITFLLPLLISLFINKIALGQSSKSCGSCHQSVSIYSEVGDYCPHCHVRWGYENTTTRYVNTYSSNSYNYGSINQIGFVTSNANLRAYASKSAYVMTVVPQNSIVKVLGRYGDWYHVEYEGVNWYSTRTGYIHKSLINF